MCLALTPFANVLKTENLGIRCWVFVMVIFCWQICATASQIKAETAVWVWPDQLEFCT